MPGIKWKVSVTTFQCWPQLWYLIQKREGRCWKVVIPFTGPRSKFTQRKNLEKSRNCQHTIRLQVHHEIFQSCRLGPENHGSKDGFFRLHSGNHLFSALRSCNQQALRVWRYHLYSTIPLMLLSLTFAVFILCRILLHPLIRLAIWPSTLTMGSTLPPMLLGSKTA